MISSKCLTSVLNICSLKTFRLSHLHIEHFSTQNVRLLDSHIDHLFTQAFRLNHFHIEKLFIQTYRVSHFTQSPYMKWYNLKLSLYDFFKTGHRFSMWLPYSSPQKQHLLFYTIQMRVFVPISKSAGKADGHGKKTNTHVRLCVPKYSVYWHVILHSNGRQGVTYCTCKKTNFLHRF